MHPGEEYIDELVHSALLEKIDQGLADVQVDVKLERKQWDQLRLEAAYYMQATNSDAETLFQKYLLYCFGPRLIPVVNGERKGPEDITASIDLQQDGDADEDGGSSDG